MQIEELIRKYLDSNYVLQLATVRDGMPQLCTVHYAFDDDLNLYWSSHRFRQHSENISSNNQSAIAVLENVDLKQCVHGEGESYELFENEAARAHKIYTKRYGKEPGKLEEVESTDKKAHAYYIFKPKLFILFDADNFPDEPRKLYEISRA